MTMVPVPLPTGFKVADDYPKARERLTNLFAIGDNRIASRPGINAQNTGIGRCRGSEFYRDRLFHASGDDLIIVPEDSNIDPTTIGTLGGADIVFFSPGHTMMIMLVRGGGLFKWEDTGGAGTFTDISDTGAEGPTTYIDVAFMDGRWIYVPADGGPLEYSEVGDGGDVRPDNFFDAELLPDKNIGVMNSRNTLYVLGEQSVELFRSTGDSTAPFSRVEGGQLQSGYLAGRIEYGATFAYVGRNIHGHTGIFIAVSGAAEKISNDAVDELLRKYTVSELYLVESQRYTWHGMDTVVFTFIEETLAFSGGEWHFISSDPKGTLDDPWTAAFTEYAYGRYYTGDLKQSRIGILEETEEDYGERIPRQIDTFMRVPPNTQMVVRSAELDTRMGLVPSVPVIEPMFRLEDHTASQWQIATDEAFTNIVFDSGVTQDDLEAISVSPALASSTLHFWHVRYQGEVSGFSDYSLATEFTTFAVGVDQPDNLTPTNGETGVLIPTTLTASAFLAVNSADVHINSQWQIATDIGFSNIVQDSGDDPVNLESYPISPDLDFSVTYYWRVRYEGDVNGYSEYSDPFQMTMVTEGVEAPTNVSPVDHELGVTAGNTPLVGSAFDDPSGRETHTASQWQVALDPAFSNIVWDSGTDAGQLTTATIVPYLDYDTTYFWHVRYQGSLTGFSPYSTETDFITEVLPDLARIDDSGDFRITDDQFQRIVDGEDEVQVTILAVLLADEGVTTPTNVSPADEAIDISVTPTLVGSPFETDATVIVPGTDPLTGFRVGLSVSQDGIVYGQTVYRPLGQFGNYAQRMQWRGPGGLGRYESFMGIRISTNAPIELSADSLALDVVE